MRLSVDIYTPALAEGPLHPAILVLQGAGVEKSEYKGFASELAGHGHWVLVPNCIPVGRDYICPTAASVSQTFDTIGLTSRPDLSAALTHGILLCGHSAGGVAAFYAALEHLEGSSRLPHVIIGIASYGSGCPLDLSAARLPPVLLLSGDADSVVPRRVTENAYQSLSGLPRTFIRLPSLHHYSITDSGQPASAPPESRASMGATATGISLVATLVHAFSLAIMSGDERWSERVERKHPGVAVKYDCSTPR